MMPVPAENGHGESLLTRFIFTRQHFSVQNARVKPDAFMPYRGELSAFRIAGLDDVEVWELGDREVAAKRERPLVARGDFASSAAVEIGLRVEFDDHPPRHANVTDWPPDSEKSAQKLLATRLAAVATLHLRE